jgi:hypothetical protein
MMAACMGRNCRLHREEARSPLYFSASQRLTKADVAAEHVAAGASRENDSVRRMKVQILPQLVGERLGALQEKPQKMCSASFAVALRVPTSAP